MSYSTALSPYAPAAPAQKGRTFTIGTDYATIREAMLAAPATATWPVTIYVPDGTHLCIQITTRAYVAVQGQSQAGTILVADGLSTDIDPASGQRYCDIAQASKHGFYAASAFALDNVTMQVNDVKYCIHGDSGSGQNIAVTDCTLKHSNGYPVGLGIYAGKTQTFTRCTFEKTGADVAVPTAGSHGVFAHNQTTQASPCTLILTDCSFVNCGVLFTSEIRSGQTDEWTLTRCSTDSVTKGVYYGAGSGTTSASAYSIEVYVVGGTMPALDFDATNRPDAASHVHVS